MQNSGEHTHVGSSNRSANINQLQGWLLVFGCWHDYNEDDDNNDDDKITLTACRSTSMASCCSIASSRRRSTSATASHSLLHKST